MTSSLISRKEKFLVFFSAIDSLCTVVSSEGLAGQEPQNQKRTLMPFSASYSGQIVRKLTTNCSLLVMSDSAWSFCLDSQLSSNRRPGWSLACLQRRKVMEVILWQSGQNNISDICTSWYEKGMLSLIAYAYFYKYLKCEGEFQYLGPWWVWRFCCQKHSLWPAETTPDVQV
jgi:hypothetical protein